MPDELKPQSIDTPEFADLMLEWALSQSGDLAQKRYEAIIAQIDAWRVPAGMKLVPIDSTAEMVRAGGNMLRACGNDKANARDAGLCWSAMIDAAPDKEPPCGS